VPGPNVIVDTTPEMRLQLIREGILRVDSVLVTHSHADHIFGMDDVRQLNFRHQMVMPVYASSETLGDLRRVFDYVFKETQAGGGKPQLDLRTLLPEEAFSLPGGIEAIPLPILHGSLPIFGFKFGQRFAYVTDASAIPAETMPYLRGLDTLILGAVRYDPHPTHFGLWQALDVIEDLKPRRAFLTHLSHTFDHATAEAKLPGHVRLAYDGLSIAIPAGATGDG
jgi:phosphoribosyl 1,2-cyclic phosphate phosphodiesterase